MTIMGGHMTIMGGHMTIMGGHIYDYVWVVT